MSEELPKRVPEQWLIYDREKHGKVPTCMLVFEGTMEQVVLGKNAIKAAVEALGLGMPEGTTTVCVTPPSISSIEPVNNVKAFETFVEVAFMLSDKTFKSLPFSDEVTSSIHFVQRVER